MQPEDLKRFTWSVCIADTRTNRIVLKGDTATRKRIRQMIEMLDVPAADRLGGLKVFRLKYASAKNLGGNFTGLGDWSVGYPVHPIQIVHQHNNVMNNSDNNNSGGSSSGAVLPVLTPSINLGAGSNTSSQNSITSFNGNGVSIIADDSPKFIGGES